MEDYSEMADLLKKLVVISDNSVIPGLVDSAFIKNYGQFYSLLHRESPVYHSILEANTISKNININIFKSSIFVVRDLSKFIEDINNKCSKKYSVNDGIQRWRGQTNSMQNFVNLFDNDFRKSLYSKAWYHKRNETWIGDFKWESLPKSNYSYVNVHMNKGNVNY